MSKILIKIAVFFLTLVLGVQTAAFVSNVIAGFSMPVKVSMDPDEKATAVCRVAKWYPDYV